VANLCNNFIIFLSQIKNIVPLNLGEDSIGFSLKYPADKKKTVYAGLHVCCLDLEGFGAF